MDSLLQQVRHWLGNVFLRWLNFLWSLHNTAVIFLNALFVRISTDVYGNIRRMPPQGDVKLQSLRFAVKMWRRRLFRLACHGVICLQWSRTKCPWRGVDVLRIACWAKQANLYNNKIPRFFWKVDPPSHKAMADKEETKIYRSRRFSPFPGSHLPLSGTARFLKDFSWLLTWPNLY